MEGGEGTAWSRPRRTGDAYRGGGGGQNKVGVPEIDLQFRAPSINFIFVPEDKCSDVGGGGGGWVGQAEEPKLPSPPSPSG